jgi:enamine deaminase RidA (YjgF/YER057c/UK114 family)
MAKKKTTRKPAPRKPRAARGKVEYINPAGMLTNPAFTQVVAATGPVKTVYVGAQTPVDGNGTLIGKGDVGLQTEQVLKNIGLCLAAAAAKPEHIVHWNIYVADGTPITPGVEAAMRWWGSRPNPPANTVSFVAALLPDMLVMIDAVAVVPE